MRHGEIGDAKEPDGACRPGLAGRPFDQLGVVLGIPIREHGSRSLRLVHTADVRLHDGVAGPHPEQRIGRFKPCPRGTVQMAEPRARKAHEQHPPPIGQRVFAVGRD